MPLHAEGRPDPIIGPWKVHRRVAPWRTAHGSIGRESTRLVRLLADEPAQRARAVAIRQAIQSYLQDYSDPLVTTTCFATC